MKFHSLRRSLVAGVFAFITAALVAGCGGGSSGATQTTQGGTLAILPVSGSVFAGVPTTFTVVGGRAPYTLTSSEPTILPVPQTLNGNTFTVAAANPADPVTGAITSRSVTVTVRDSLSGTSVTGVYNVLQNFLTGFGLTFNVIACSTTITSTTPTTGLSVPNGCEIALQFNAAANGARFGDRPYKIEVLRGPVVLVDKVTGQTGSTLNVTSDHEGKVVAIMRTTQNVPTQLAVIRITDVATGVFTDTVFTVTAGSTTATMVTVPASVTFTGPDTNTCGGGDVDVYVFGGLPPYSAASTFPNDITVFPIDPNNNPGVFRVRALGGCITNGTVIFTDRFGSHTTFTVTTVKGTAPPPAPPTPPVTITPSTITLACGATGSVTITGGTPPYSAASANSNVTATITGNTLSLTRSAVGAAPTSSPVNVTDGNTIATITVNSPATCP